MTDDRRLSAPAFARNREPILGVLQALFPEGADARILEIGSGTGEHAVYFSGAMPWLQWQPSDADPQCLASIEAWIRSADAGARIGAPVRLDAATPNWDLPDPTQPFAGMVAINVIHIAPWAVAEGIVAGAARHLRSGGALMFYGPFRRGGRHTAPSNAAFDQSLRRQDPAWGVRDLDDLTVLARGQGLGAAEVTELPSNNLAVVFRARG